VAGLEVAGFADLPARRARRSKPRSNASIWPTNFLQRCDQLSGGQLQRVGIARVLYQQADLILADEPVSALDPTLALSAVRLLIADAEARGATLVASLHAVDLALSNFSRIVGVKAGRIAFDLPASEISVPLLQELYSSEGEELPVQAHKPHFLSQTAANDAATRAACC
jgi:phosphonate transport system ATP-binding protein